MLVAKSSALSSITKKRIRPAEAEKDKIRELLSDTTLVASFQLLEMRRAPECAECIRVCPIGQKTKVERQSD